MTVTLLLLSIPPIFTHPAHHYLPTPSLLSLSTFLLPIAMSSSSSSNANPFPWGIGWRAFFLGWSAGDRTKFENTMEVCSNFGSMPDMQNESNAVLMKATKEELKTLIPDPAKGAMAVDIIRWAMNQAVSDDAKQRKKWCKYKNYWAPNDRRAAVYWETAIAPPAVIGGEPKEEEEEAVHMPARAPEPGRRTWQIDLDSAEDDDDDPPARTAMKKKMKASGSTSRSARR